jgi:serine/threonine protein phosphatase 1
MIYVISDLHGYPLERFLQLLEKASFGKDDFLYILGDVVDRNGDGGVEMLQWLMYQTNVELIMGNHEAMLLSNAFVFDEMTEESLDSLTEEKRYRRLEIYAHLVILSSASLRSGDVTCGFVQPVDQ